MKKLITLLLALVATNTLWAYDFSVDGIYYNILTDKTNEVEVASGYPKYTGDIIIPSSVTYNGSTYSVTTIGLEAFHSCYKMTSVIIPGSVTSIRPYAFQNCDSLTSITLPDDLTTIGSNAFAFCENLTSINIPNNVTTIGGKAFVGCSSWSGNVTIPNNVKRIDYQTFGDCSSLTSITLPDGVIAIETWAFGGCSSLTSINIPDDVTSIGDGAFYNCSSLTSINIPDGVTNIEYSTFFGCSSLSSIILPAGVTSIGRFAFGDCSSLTSITCKAITPPAVESPALSNNISKDIPVYVPCESVADYQADAEWSYFTNIQCMPEDESAVDNVHSQSPMANCQKTIRNGQLIILRDGKTYNVMGMEVGE